MYGILAHEKLRQRSLEDTFNDPVFKVLFPPVIQAMIPALHRAQPA
jgi:hypothetical protein